MFVISRTLGKNEKITISDIKEITKVYKSKVETLDLQTWASSRYNTYYKKLGSVYSTEEYFNSKI